MIKCVDRTLNNSSETDAQKLGPSHCVFFVLAIVTVLSRHMEWFRPLGPPNSSGFVSGSQRLLGLCSKLIPPFTGSRSESIMIWAVLYRGQIMAVTPTGWEGRARECGTSQEGNKFLNETFLCFALGIYRHFLNLWYQQPGHTHSLPLSQPHTHTSFSTSFPNCRLSKHYKEERVLELKRASVIVIIMKEL